MKQKNWESLDKFIEQATKAYNEIGASGLLEEVSSDIESNRTLYTRFIDDINAFEGVMDCICLDRWNIEKDEQKKEGK
jgi:hypothetical protein